VIIAFRFGVFICTVIRPGGCVRFATEEISRMKKSRGGRMTAAKKRAAKRKGGKGPVRTRKAGKNIMKT